MSTRLNTNVGDYHIIDFIGNGGMGEVYRARHTKLDREVAIKFLSVVGKDNSSQERFLREARILSKLNHKNIVILYDFTNHQNQPCIIMEYVDGVTLLQYIDENGPMSPDEAKTAFETVLEAISYIHENGIIHRDIKSNNIMISCNNEIKLLDFGIAKTNQGTRITQTPQLIGTDEYLAPELIKQGEASISSDIWALGVLLYEMATAQLPFQDKDRLKLYRKIETATYVPPSKICLSATSQIDKIVSRCLQKKPAERYQSARELLSDIRSATKPLASIPTPNPNNPISRITNKIDIPIVQQKKFLPVILGGLATLSLSTALYFWPTHLMDGHNRNINIKLEVMYAEDAEIYDQEGTFLGKTSNRNFEYKAYLGEKIFLIIKKEGYEDYKFKYTIDSENTKPVCPIAMERIQSK